jgi:hypothetical protein
MAAATDALLEERGRTHGEWAKKGVLFARRFTFRESMN